MSPNDLRSFFRADLHVFASVATSTTLAGSHQPPSRPRRLQDVHLRRKSHGGVSNQVEDCNFRHRTALEIMRAAWSWIVG